VKVFARAVGNKVGEMYIYEGIGEGWFGGVSAKQVSEDLKKVGKVETLNVYLNSPGGSVFDGIAIYNQISRFDAKKIVHVDGIAASIASIILLAGDERRIAKNGQVMIHDPWGMSAGTANDFRKQAEVLDNIRETLLQTYVDRTPNKRESISNWMTEETWFNAADAKKYGFVDLITDQQASMSEFAMLANYKNVPDNLKRVALSNQARLARMDMRLGKGPRPNA